MSNEGTPKIYRYGNEEIVNNEGLSHDQIRQAWATVHAGIANAELVCLGDNVYEFRTAGGDKGC